MCSYEQPCNKLNCTQGHQAEAAGRGGRRGLKAVIAAVNLQVQGSRASLAKCWALAPTELRIGWSILDNSLGE